MLNTLNYSLYNTLTMQYVSACIRCRFSDHTSYLFGSLLPLLLWSHNFSFIGYLPSRLLKFQQKSNFSKKEKIMGLISAGRLKAAAALLGAVLITEIALAIWLPLRENRIEPDQNRQVFFFYWLRKSSVVSLVRRNTL